MNSKAIKRQLLAAIAMVLVAAIALGSSTYAWFVASNSVTAEGMTVQAQSESGLAISFQGTDWGTSASAGVATGVKLYPASTKDLTKWSHATAKTSNNKTATQETRENITDKVFDGTSGAFKDGNGYVFMKEFKIRSTATGEAQSKGLYVKSITVTGATQKMSAAMRVGVRYNATNSGNNKSYIYAPVSLDGATPLTSYNWYQDADDANGSPVTIDQVGKTTSTLIGENTEISSDASKAEVVQIYIWFEGEDDQLFSDNFKAEDLNVTVEFSSIQPDTAAA